MATEASILRDQLEAVLDRGRVDEAIPGVAWERRREPDRRLGDRRVDADGLHLGRQLVEPRPDRGPSARCARGRRATPVRTTLWPQRPRHPTRRWRRLRVCSACRARRTTTAPRDCRVAGWSLEVPGGSRAEQLVVVSGTQLQACQLALQRMRAFGGHQPCHGSPALRDLDLVSVGNVVEQGQILALTSVAVICRVMWS